MEFLSRTFNVVIHRLLPAGRAPLPKEANRMNAYLNAFYKVLVGDNPKLNFMALAVLTVLLRLIQTFELKFYCALAVICLVLVVCDYFFERRNLKAERNTSTNDALQQIINLLMNVTAYLCTLRRNNPSGFCAALCGVFVSILVIANNLSGYAVMYLILIVIFTAPLIYQKIPTEYIMNVKQIVTVHTNEGVLAESELLPFIGNEDFNERDADLESLLTDRTADSVTNSLISGIASMPSHLDAEGGSLDGLEEEDLEFAIRSTQASGISVTPGDLSSDSDSDPDRRSMNFESSHFNRDSSSEDENSYSNGLLFAEIARSLTDNSRLQESSSSEAKNTRTSLERSTQAAVILGNLSAISSNLIRSLKPNDSDSDFEIIDSDEVDDVVN